MRKKYSWLAISLITAVAVSVIGCSRGTDVPSGNPDVDLYKSYLFMTDSYQGLVYTYDPASHTASSTSLATVVPSAGEIYFHGGEGYVCVGYGTKAGVYRFDPSSANPAFTKIGEAIDAQYIAFYSDTKAYVSTYGDGMYSFDPSSSSPTFAAITATAGLTLQDVVVGSDGMIYAADNLNDKVIRLDPATDTISATISTNATGTTGLFAGAFDGGSGVFVANTGGYGSSAAGSIDFIANGAADGSTARVIVDTISGGGAILPARLVQLADGDLIATGSGMTTGHTYKVDIVGNTASASELTASGQSFGSLDIDLKDGLVYIPVGDYMSGTSLLYVMDADGAQVSFSPLSVMEEGVTCISNIAFYED